LDRKISFSQTFDVLERVRARASLGSGDPWFRTTGFSLNLTLKERNIS